MADDRIDWADVAAIGFLAARLDDVYPLPAAIEWHADGGEDRDQCDAIAAALREAHEAGLRERIDVLDCDACGERHMTERGAAIVAENRELRRELEETRARLAKVERERDSAAMFALGLEVEDE